MAVTELRPSQYRRFPLASQAVREDYYFQMFYDDLPIWGFVGKMEKISKPHGTEYRYYLFTHGETRSPHHPVLGNVQRSH